MCKRSASANDSKYIKDKLSAPDEIHDLQSETIEHVERLAEILSEGSKEIRVIVKYFILLSSQLGSRRKEPASRAGMTLK